MAPNLEMERRMLSWSTLKLSSQFSRSWVSLSSLESGHLMSPEQIFSESSFGHGSVKKYGRETDEPAGWPLATTSQLGGVISNVYIWFIFQALFPCYWQSGTNVAGCSHQPPAQPLWWQAGGWRHCLPITTVLQFWHRCSSPFTIGWTRHLLLEVLYH